MSYQSSISDRPSWTFLTNHSHVLVCLLLDPTIKVKDVATKVGISERAALRIIAELGESKIIAKTRVGRRNQYKVKTGSHLRHPLESRCTLRDIFDPIVSAKPEGVVSRKRK